MADAVQALLEEMVVELQGFVEHGVLTTAEVRALVKKRTDFEYRLRRRAADKRDFERYIEYEMTFERLLKARRERLGTKQGKGTGKFSCVRHIHFIFDRAVKKFKGDVGLWLEWINYAKSESSSKVLSKVFARALQMHPRNDKLWVHAAAYEWDMGNVTAARTLLQRGIRLNSSSEELWREYFRMEALFTARLAERRRVLGLAGAGGKEPTDSAPSGDGAITLASLDEEGGEGAAEADVKLPDPQEADSGLNDLLAGSIPRAVVRYARETHGKAHLFLEMYDLCYLAGDAARRALQDEILAVIDNLAADPPSPPASTASSAAAMAAQAATRAAALTGAATRRAARALADAAAGGAAEAAACDAAQRVLDVYLGRPVASPRKRGRAAPAADAGVPDWGASNASDVAAAVASDAGMTAALWEAACGFWAEIEAQAKGGRGKGASGGGVGGSVGSSPALALEAGARASAMLAGARAAGVWSEHVALESIRRVLTGSKAPGKELGKGKGTGKRRRGDEGGGDSVEAEALVIAGEAVRQVKGNVKVAAEFLRLLAKAIMAGGVSGGGLERLVEEMDTVLVGCGQAEGVEALWADRVEMQIALGGGADALVAVLLRAVSLCGGEAAQVLLKGLAAVEAGMGSEEEEQVGRLLLARPLPSAVRGALIQSLVDRRLARCAALLEPGGLRVGRGGHGKGAAEVQEAMRGMREVMELWAEEGAAKDDHEVWVRWEQVERAAGEHKRGAGVHWRALRCLRDPDAYHAARAVH